VVKRANIQERERVFRESLEAVTLPGLILEFGVYKGRSINKIGKFFPDRLVFGFDSFEGLPEDFTKKHKKASYTTDGKLPKVRSNVKLIRGWFQDTLPTFLKMELGPVAYINFDADLYSSTKFILDCLKGRIISDTILYFDEFVTPDFDGEYRAFKESGIDAELLGYWWFESEYSSFAYKVR
jgi:hypothetical protein